jgi:hypothetical protein
MISMQKYVLEEKTELKSFPQVNEVKKINDRTKIKHVLYLHSVLIQN